MVAAPTREPFSTEHSEAPPVPRLLLLPALLDDFAADAAAAHEAYRTGKPRGPVSGLGRLDQELGGCFAPGLHILHGNTGTGKTAFVWQIAATTPCPAQFVSCEMGPP